MRQVIQGLEEGLSAIAEALEGGGGGGSSIVPTPTAQDEGKVLTAGDDGTASWETPEGGIPTPTLDDESKVLRVIPQTQTTVAPEWASIREVPTGGQNGQVLTKNSGGYGWAAPAGGLPEVTSSSRGKFLGVNSSNNTVTWKDISQVPSTSGVTHGYVLTNAGGTPTWAAAASGGGGVSVYRAQGAYLKSNFRQVASGDYSGMYKANVYFFDADGNSLRDLSSIINVSIMVRTYRDEYGFKFKAIDGALAISEYSGDNDTLFISAEDYNALDAENDKVYATVICVPDVV